jgi:5-methylcytosine-specific restriction endonuclease McrA
MNQIYNNKKWRSLRLVVLKRDDYTCAYCSKPANTVDHVVPLARGGDKYDTNNLVAACIACNSAKRDRGSFFNREKHPRPPFSFFSPDQSKPTPSPFADPDSL